MVGSGVWEMSTKSGCSRKGWLWLWASSWVATLLLLASFASLVASPEDDASAGSVASLEDDPITDVKTAKAAMESIIPIMKIALIKTGEFSKYLTGFLSALAQLRCLLLLSFEDDDDDDDVGGSNSLGMETSNRCAVFCCFSEAVAGGSGGKISSKNSSWSPGRSMWLLPCSLVRLLTLSLKKILSLDLSVMLEQETRVIGNH